MSTVEPAGQRNVCGATLPRLRSLTSARIFLSFSSFEALGRAIAIERFIKQSIKMGWFWGSSDNKPDGTANDPYSKLDPALREYLDKESPVKYADTLPKPSPDRPAESYRSQVGWDKPGLNQNNQDSVPAENKPAVPKESLFPDGRYAHLWSTYRPQTEIENTGKSDQDRMKDVFDAYNDRKAAIGRAAIENCVMEQIAEKECLTKGSWARRATMCREENRSFMRCYEMQGRFLKALGYLSSPRSEEEEERIQMHADKLYHEMLAREAQAEEARKEGLPTPVLPPLIEPDETRKALGSDSAWARIRQQAGEQKVPTKLSEYSPEKQKVIREKIKGMEPEERELELQLIAAESRSQLEYAEQIRKAMEEEGERRKERRERGKETIGDSLKRLWGWDK